LGEISAKLSICRQHFIFIVLAKTWNRIGKYLAEFWWTLGSSDFHSLHLITWFRIVELVGKLEGKKRQRQRGRKDCSSAGAFQLGTCLSQLVFTMYALEYQYMLLRIKYSNSWRLKEIKEIIQVTAPLRNVHG
jgi:hypothetical protein